MACQCDLADDLLTPAVTGEVVNDMKQRREEQRKGNLHLPLGSTTVAPPTDSTPSPDEHPEFGVLPCRPPLTPPAPSGSTGQRAPSETPGHTPLWVPTLDPPPRGQRYKASAPSQPQPEKGSPPQHSMGCGCESCTSHQNGRPHPPSSHVTGSTSDSSVFTYGSSYSDSSQAPPSSSQATPSSVGSEVSTGGGLNILHFSYMELSEATGGFTEGMVGIGAFGTVFRAKIRGNGPFAIKKLHTVSEWEGGTGGWMEGGREGRVRRGGWREGRGVGGWVEKGGRRSAGKEGYLL